MQSSPCAYWEEGRCVSLLTHHSWATLRLAVGAAERLLGAPRLLPSRSVLLGALEVASVYHDLGKASLLYQQARRSFPLHEHVGAIALWRAAELAVESGLGVCGAMLAVAAGAVARHHAAMAGRHPASLYSDGDREAVEQVARALSQLPPSTAGLLAGGQVAQLVERAIQELAGEASLDKIRRYGRSLLEQRFEGADLLADTIMVAGPLIVGDILAASIERRGEVYKSYARSWLRELRQSEDHLRAVVASARSGQPPELSCPPEHG